MSNVKRDDRREPRPPMGRTARVFGCIGLGIIGFALYWLCAGMFDGYPQYHTRLLTWIAISVLAAIGLVVWIVDERRHRDDED
jgi:hypothetical protein